MKGLISDVNIEGCVDYLIDRLNAEPWKLFWDYLNVQYVHFAKVSLKPESKDSLVWETCQRYELILITDNRNDDGPDSLESTIREKNEASSLPVFTISDIDRFRESTTYVDRVIERLITSLLEIDALRGTGRQFLP